MAEYLANAVQEVDLNSPILFTASIPCPQGNVYHEDETGVFILRGPNASTCNRFARYQITFNGNIAIPTGGAVTPIAVAISKNVDGKRIVCMNDKYITYPETPNKPSSQTTYMINGAGGGNVSYTTTSVLGLCDGLTKEEAYAISKALQIFAEEVNIIGKPPVS